MTTLYLTTAIIGGTLTVLQLCISALGFGDHDAGGHDGGGVTDHESMFWGIFSLRAILAAITAFGLSGLSAHSLGASAPVSLPVALVGAFGAMMLVAFFLRTLVKLADDGTARIENAVGAQGVVYINIPPHSTDSSGGHGMGKVHLNLQHRTVELDAVTYDTHPIETGTRIVVTSVVGPGMVEVISAPEMGTHYENASSQPESARTV